MKTCVGRVCAAFMLAELLVGMAVASLVFAALAIGSLSLQRTYNAVEAFGSSQADQLRCLDYISRDVRRAQSVSVAASPSTLTVVVQSYIDSSTGLPRNPSISNGAITYGGTSTITYTLSGTSLIRTEGGRQLVVGKSITSFNPALDAADATNKTVTVRLNSNPSLKWRSKSSNPTTFTMLAKVTARN